MKRAQIDVLLGSYLSCNPHATKWFIATELFVIQCAVIRFVWLRISYKTWLVPRLSSCPRALF